MRGSGKIGVPHVSHLWAFRAGAFATVRCRPAPMKGAVSASLRAHTHLTSREAEGEMLIYEDLSALGKERYWFGEGSLGALRVMWHTAPGCVAYLPFPGTIRLFCTENTPATPLALIPARFLSDWRSTTPSRATCPPFTMMLIGLLTPTPQCCTG